MFLCGLVALLCCALFLPVSHNESRYRRRADSVFVCDSEDAMHGDKLSEGKDEEDSGYGYGYGHEYGAAPISTHGQGQSFKAYQSRPLYWNGYAHPAELFDDVAKKKATRNTHTRTNSTSNTSDNHAR